MELYSRKRGAGDAVILLHGLFGSMDNLGVLMRGLEDSYTVIGVDLRNHGRSRHALPHDTDTMAADVFEVMNREGINSAYIYGHSMGGKVAMQMALMAPSRVKGLIIGDIAPVLYPRHHSAILEGMQALAKEDIESREAATSFMRNYEDTPAVLSFLLTNLRRDDDGKLGWRLGLDNIAADYDLFMQGLDGGPYTGPVLFLKGGDSDYIKSEHREKILSLFPAATVKIIEGAGHWFHAEKPELTVRLVKDFLEKL